MIRKEVQYYGIVVAQVSDTREPGIKPFEDVKEQITRAVTQRKKMDKLKSMAASDKDKQVRAAAAKLVAEMPRT